MLALLVSFVSGSLLMWGLAELELIPWRRAGAEHWTDKARRLFPALNATVLNTWLIPTVFALAGRVFWPGVSWVPFALGGIAGTTLGGYALDRAVLPQLPVRSWLHLVGVNWIMRLVRWGPFVAAVFLMPRQFNWLVAVVAGSFLTVQLAAQFGLTLIILRWVRLLRPASPRLSLLVAEASSATPGLVRATWELSVPQANALAYITTRELVFTTKLIEIAPDDELRAICRHELAHLAESRWILMGRLFGTLALFPLIFVRPAYAAMGDSGVSLPVLLALIMWWVRIPLNRAMEKRADRLATEPEASAEPVYARALERLYRENQMPAVMSKNSLKIHPDLYDRMVAAHLTPDYPRPLPPSSRAWSATILMIILLGLAIYLTSFPRHHS